jgi:hypothetical protein
MDWLLVVLLAVQSPGGSVQTVEKRETVRSELACHTAIMRHMETKGQQVIEAECQRARLARSLRAEARSAGQRVASVSGSIAPR